MIVPSNEIPSIIREDNRGMATVCHKTSIRTKESGAREVRGEFGMDRYSHETGDDQQVGFSGDSPSELSTNCCKERSATENAFQYSIVKRTL